jgi:hemoglobin
MANDKKTLYERLGGYDAITAVANDLLPRLRADPPLSRFWAHRGEDGVMREKQLLIETQYLGWAKRTSHRRWTVK